ncbi:hypothetical protein KR018_002842 [Drosophila ironensis]|nr:hypothetical protein KR018_002842 [Drosophila ironensis]
MFPIRVFLILIWTLNGDCSVLIPVLKPSNLKGDSPTNVGFKESLIEAQSIGRIVNRPNNQFVQDTSHINDVHRTANIDRGHPCVHELSDASELTVREQPKINENPLPAAHNDYATYISHSTHSQELALQMQSPTVTQHIHYHYLVPNTPPNPSPTINYASQLPSNVYDGKAQNTYSAASEGLNANNGAIPTRSNEYPYDPSDEYEYQGQASENKSVYESVLKQPDEPLRGEDQRLEEVAAAQTNRPEVYFITYKGDKDVQTTDSPAQTNGSAPASAVFDGSGLIDIRSGKDEGNTIKSTTELPESSSARVYSAYDVPLN